MKLDVEAVGRTLRAACTGALQLVHFAGIGKKVAQFAVSWLFCDDTIGTRKFGWRIEISDESRFPLVLDQSLTLTCH